MKRFAPKAAFPIQQAIPAMTDPCGLAAYLQQKYVELLTGGAPIEVETPLLGRVQFAPANADQLGRLLGEVQSKCAALQGQTTLVRRPISFDTRY
jgi:hypothetical protein